MPLNINLDTTSGLKFQQPNIPPGRTSMEGLAAGLGPMLQQVPSLMLQYQNLKQQRELADLDHQLAVEDRKQKLELRRDMLQNPQKYGGFYMDVNGVPQFVALPEGYKPAPIPSAKKPSENETINVPKSEFLREPEKFKNAGKLKIVDDTGVNKGPEGKKQLPTAEVRTMTEGASVLRMLPNIGDLIEKNQDIMGPVKGRIGSKNPYNTRAQSTQAEIRATSQAFGRFMEAGVLRKEDEEKYYKMFPQLSDKPEIARNKLESVTKILARQYNDKKNSLSESGYDASGLLDIGGGNETSDMITVSNGVETFQVPESDLAEAQAEGFQVVQ